MTITQYRSDRRFTGRFYTVNMAVRVSVLGDGSSSAVNGQIVNIGREGVFLICKGTLPEKGRVQIEIYHEKSAHPLRLLGNVIWTEAGEEGWLRCGINLSTPFKKDGDLFQFLAAFGELSPVKERRKGDSKKTFPVKRRSADDLLYFQSDYPTFMKDLEEMARSHVIHTVFLARNVTYLKMRVSRLLPQAQVLTTEDLKESLPTGTLLLFDLDCRRKHESFYFWNFEEHAVRTDGGRQDPLDSLAAVSRWTETGTELLFMNLRKIREEDRGLVAKHLMAVKFEDVRFLQEHILRARKRPLARRVFNSDLYLLEEVQDPRQIEEIQKFAAGIFPKDYNFSQTIDSLFNTHSDFYAIRNNRSGELINFARISYQLPSHVLPCMMAHAVGQPDSHLQLNDPDAISYGEVFSPYLRSLSAAKIYGELVKVILSYGEKGLIDVMFTTYGAAEAHASQFFAKYLGFRETGVSLTYGDFGGKWNLIFCSVDSFYKNLKLNFVSSREAPSIISQFIQ